MSVRDSSSSFKLHSGPAKRAQSITPGNSGSGAANGEVTLAGHVCRGIIIATEGAVVITQYNDVDATLTVPAGLLPLAGIKRIKATGTTATGFTALYDPEIE